MGYHKIVLMIISTVISVTLWKELAQRVLNHRKIVLTQRKRKFQRELACEKFEYIMELTKSGTYEDLLNFHRSLNQMAETMSTNGSKLHNYSWRVKGLWFSHLSLTL